MLPDWVVLLCNWTSSLTVTLSESSGPIGIDDVERLWRFTRAVAYDMDLFPILILPEIAPEMKITCPLLSPLFRVNIGFPKNVRHLYCQQMTREIFLLYG